MSASTTSPYNAVVTGVDTATASVSSEFNTDKKTQYLLK